VKVRKLGHACLLVESDGARVLLDPGSFAPGFEDLRDLDAVFVTHQHPDHLDVDRVDALLAANPTAAIYSDPGSAEILGERGHAATSVAAGDLLEVEGLAVEVFGAEHAEVHPDIPRIPNTGYLLGDRLFHPGDALTLPGRPVDVLALPTAAPWLKAAEAVEYLRAVSPRVAVPIHDRAAGSPQMYYGLFRQLAPAGTAVEILDDGEPRTL
jgi:L-ascorbate metabolism protein UlaG (beta-lactamase superfamily)